MSRTRLEVSKAAPGVFILCDSNEKAEDCERRLTETFLRWLWAPHPDGLRGRGW